MLRSFCQKNFCLEEKINKKDDIHKMTLILINNEILLKSGIKNHNLILINNISNKSNK